MSMLPSLQTVVLRDALISLLAEQRRNFMSGGALCVKTVLCALLETREASLEVIDAITRCGVKQGWLATAALRPQCGYTYEV